MFLFLPHNIRLKAGGLILCGPGNVCVRVSMICSQVITAFKHLVRACAYTYTLSTGRREQWLMKRLSVPLFSFCGECGTGTRCCNDTLYFGLLVGCNHTQLDQASERLNRMWSHVYTEKHTFINCGHSSYQFPALSLDSDLFHHGCCYTCLTRHTSC